MNLTLYMHPLSSYCHKVLIALYENDIPFKTHFLDLMNEAVRRDFLAMWPIGKMPLLRDEEKGQTVIESSIILEYLDMHYPGKTRFLPTDPERRLEARRWDRICDLYLHHSMQKIVGDRLRPEGKGDPFGVEEAKERVRTVYQMIDREMADKTWALGEEFTIADCSAAPALFYSNRVLPLDGYQNAAAYLERLKERPSYTRALREAEPYFKLFPGPKEESGNSSNK